MSRTTCFSCGRPGTLCVCAQITPVAHRTPVTVIQHPAERHHPFNTVRLAKLCLQRLTVKVAWKTAIPRPELPADAALIYPSETAELLSPQTAPAHLVLIDGTWSQAATLYRANPWMAELRQVKLAPAAPSAYGIRKEPAAHCLSTIEALRLALGAIEPENPDLDRILDGFHAMVAGQISHQSHTKASPRREVRRTKPTLRQQLALDWHKLVVVYAETTPLRERAAKGVEVLQWAAVRPATGEVFDCIHRTRALPDACQLAHMGLGADDLAEAVPSAELRRAWEAFSHDGDRYMTWSGGAARAGLALFGEPPPLIHLKSIYCNLRHGGPCGRPDQVLAREGLLPTAVVARGRAAQRLGNAAALAEFLADPPPG